MYAFGADDTTDTLHVTSNVQPSNNLSDRFVTINGTRYLERIYETDQTGATKTLNITRTEGAPATDLQYFEYTFINSTTWNPDATYTVSNPAHFPEDISKAYVEVRGKRDDVLDEKPLTNEDYEVTVTFSAVTVTS